MVDSALQKLIETGLLGALLALSVSANWFLTNLLIKSYEKRVEDAKESRDTLIEPMKAVKSTVDLILTIMQNNKK